jgi:hypothetical protein
VRKKSLLTYGLLAGVGYLVYRHLQTSAAPAVAIAPAAAAPGVSGFGRLGYYPNGQDRPFAQANAGPGAPNFDGPFSRHYYNLNRWMS